MNDKIHHLAKLAGLNLATTFKGDQLVFGTYCSEQKNHVTILELERFAKLIIAESVRVITPDGSDNEQLIHPDVIRQECIVEIKDHFGVNDEYHIKS